MPHPEANSITNVINFVCCGVGIALTYDSHIPASKILPILPPGSSNGGADEIKHNLSLIQLKDPKGTIPQTYLIRGGLGQANRIADLSPAIVELRRRVHLCVAEHALDHVFVHAGVAARNGRAIVCPGPSYAGKSTLVWALLQAGYSYYSDEYAVFDREGKIHPFPLPIALREQDGERSNIAAGKVGTAPLNKCLILFARYRNHRTWRPTTLTPGQTTLWLMKNSPAMRKTAPTVLPVLKKVALATDAYLGERGDTQMVLEWLNTLDI